MNMQKPPLFKKRMSNLVRRNRIDDRTAEKQKLWKYNESDKLRELIEVNHFILLPDDKFKIYWDLLMAL